MALVGIDKFVRPLASGDDASESSPLVGVEKYVRPLAAPSINTSDDPIEMPAERRNGPDEDQPMPETRATIDAQMTALREGRRNAVLITPGSEWPPVPRGYTATATDKGIFIHHRRRVSSSLVQSLVHEDRHGELLGHVEPKSESTTQLVVARDPESDQEIQSSYVSPQNVDAQVAEFKQQYPDAQIGTGGRELEQQLLQDRVLQDREVAGGEKPATVTSMPGVASPSENASDGEPQQPFPAEPANQPQNVLRVPVQEGMSQITILRQGLQLKARRAGLDADEAKAYANDILAKIVQKGGEPTIATDDAHLQQMYQSGYVDLTFSDPVYYDELNQRLAAKNSAERFPSSGVDKQSAEQASAPQSPVSRDVRPGPYSTQLSPDEEKQFQEWVKQNKVPFDDSPQSDYDMRGYWKKYGGTGRTQINASDHLPHYPDEFKTPYHKTFSNESIYASPDAPHWENNRLIDKSGNVVADETPKLKGIEKYARPLSSSGQPHTSSRIIEEDMSPDYASEINQPAGVDAFVPVTIQLPKDQGRPEDLSPSALSRRAFFQFAQSHGVPDDFTKDWLDREDLAGHLQPYDIASGRHEATADILNDPQAYDPQSGNLTLKLRKSYADKLLDEWEQNGKGYFQHIAEDYHDPSKKAGQVAYDIVAPPVAAAAHGLEVASRPVRAASTLINATDQAKLQTVKRIAGDPSAHPLDVLTGAPAAAWQELTTGSRPAGYDNLLTTTTQDIAGPTMAKINPHLPEIARLVTDIAGDPLVMAGVAGKVGKIGRAVRAGEEAASLESRLSKLAGEVEKQTGTRPAVSLNDDGSFRLAFDGEDGAPPVHVDIRPGDTSHGRAPAFKVDSGVYEHSDLGRVVRADNQENVPRGFMRVALMDDPDVEHVVNRSRLGESPMPAAYTEPTGAPQSLVRRTVAQALDLYNATRSIKTSFDLSAPRNSLILSLTRPVKASRAFARQIEAFGSEAAATNFMRAMETDAVKPLADEAGLQLTRLDGSVAGREEMFRSAIAEKIPGVRASERAFHTYLNELRFSSFKDYVVTHPAASPEDLKGVARAINFFSGRGSFGKLEGSRIVTGLSEALYAPRLTLSYVQSLASPAMGTKAAKLFAARHVAQFVATGLALGGLAKLTSKQTGVDFELDPRSSDFGKFKIGRQRVNLFGGFSALARYTAQAITGQGKSQSGRISDKDRAQTIIDYGRTRLHPSLGFVIDLKTGKTVDGRKLYQDGKLDEGALLRDGLMPLSAGDIWDAAQQERADGGSGAKSTALVPLALSGFDVQTRAPKPATDSQREYIFQLADRSKVDADDVSRRLTGQPVEKLSGDDASKVIEELKNSTAQPPARPTSRRRLKGFERYVQPLERGN